MQNHPSVPPPHRPRRKLFTVTAVALLTILADQISKQVVLQRLTLGELRPVIPNLWNLTLTFNRGAAFGLWSNLPPGWREAVLALTACAAIGVVILFLRQPAYQGIVTQAGLAAVLGGALGNIIDRVRFGAVVDFLDFYVGTYHWPAFNIADSAICCGVATLLLWPARPPARAASQPSAPE